MSESMGCLEPEREQMLAAYELGLLTPEERAEFESHLERCPVCVETIYEMAPYTVEILKDAGTIRTRLTAAGVKDGWWPRLLRSLGAIPGQLTSWSDWLPVGATAAAVLLVVVLLQTGGTGGGYATLADLEPPRYVRMETRAGGQTEADRLFREGMDAYTRGDHNAASLVLTACIRTGEQERDWRGLDQARLYLGVSLLRTDRIEEARMQLAAAAASPFLPIVERSQWFLAQACLLEDDPGGALEYLAILAETSIGYRDEAARQIEEIRLRLDDRGGSSRPPTP